MNFLESYYTNMTTFKIFFNYQVMHVFIHLTTTFQCLLYVRPWVLEFNGEQNAVLILMEFKV